MTVFNEAPFLQFDLAPSDAISGALYHGQPVATHAEIFKYFTTLLESPITTAIIYNSKCLEYLCVVVVNPIVRKSAGY